MFTDLISTLVNSILPFPVMISGVLLVALGILALWRGADWLVDGASNIAQGLGIPSIIIGLTIVAFGTSLPELIVSTHAALAGSSDISLGNVVGSNIVNVFFILGVTAALKSIPVLKSTFRAEFPLAILAAAILLVFYPMGIIGRWQALILLLIFVGFFIYTIFQAREGHHTCTTKSCLAKAARIKRKARRTFPLSIALIVVGLAVLVIGGTLTVEGAKIIASSFGLSQVIIGLTIVAIGTSLPELVTSVMSALKGHTDLAIGNIVGSSIFNTFFILGVTGSITPININRELQLDLWFNLATFIVVMIMVASSGKHLHLKRWHGVVLLAVYMLYLGIILSREFA